MAATLYAAKGGNVASDLYTIAPLTGVETSVGPMGIAVTGLAVHPITGVCYAVTSNASPGGTNRKLYIVDLITGATLLVGPLGLGTRVIPDIAFDSAGVLYGWSSGNQLCTIDLTTGTATPFGAGVASISGGGIGIDSTDVAYTAFQLNPQHLEIVDLTTGNITSDIGAMTGLGSPNAAAFAFDDTDVLWAVFLNSGAAQLATVTLGGAVTIIGSMAANMDALTWGPVDSGGGGGGGGTVPGPDYQRIFGFTVEIDDDGVERVRNLLTAGDT